MSKIRNISGFPEWLPGQKLVEEAIVERITAHYKRAGFVPIETPAVELLSTLSAKGSVENEIYLLKRLHADSDEQAKEELALHFDLTVPFSRYVAQHFSQLTFPFKRYQLQKVWRGERPQKGRYREFYQFDIDIICREELPIACDAEALDVFTEALASIGLPPFEIRINDRKILLGIYTSLGLASEQRSATILIVDKIDKIGANGVEKLLREEVLLNEEQIACILDISKMRLRPHQAAEALAALEITDPLFNQGREDLLKLLELIAPETSENVIIDLSLARGLDYYTGLILEVRLIDHPEFGSIGSGGRYDNLASQFISQRLPGVGFSIGVSRILGLLFENNLLDTSKSSTTEVLVAVYSEDQRTACNKVARELRGRGVATEVFYKSPKLGKQIDYADAKGIPYVLFIDQERGTMQVKNLATKDQYNIADIKDFAQKLVAA